MLFLVELDHVKPTAPIPPEAGRAFIEQILSKAGRGRYARGESASSACLKIIDTPLITRF